MFQRQFIASQRFKCFSHLQLCSSVTTAAISSLELTFEYVHKHVSYTNKNESVPPHSRLSYTSSLACVFACAARAKQQYTFQYHPEASLSDWQYTKHSKVFHCLEYSGAVRHSHDIKLDRTSFHAKKPGTQLFESRLT